MTADDWTLLAERLILAVCVIAAGLFACGVIR